MKVSEVLTEARAEVEKGWYQGGYEDGYGGVCALGAIRRVVAKTIHPFLCYQDAHFPLAEKLQEIYGFDSISQFNDEPTTTKQDVLDLFDKTIIGLEEVGR